MGETIKNLAKAFVGESQARNRYTFYAKIAKQEGFEQISEIFYLTAENEKEHAKTLFKFIQQLKNKSENPEEFETISINTEVPTVFGNTIANLESAIKGETYETETMYPGFADIAEKEGLKEIADRLRSIAVAERHHKERYEALLKNVKENTVFKKETEVWWVCRECGYLHYGKEPPETCPSCGHPKSFFELKSENY